MADTNDLTTSSIQYNYGLFYRHYIKRTFDITLSLLLLIIASPLMLVAILLVYFKNKNVFFTQDRPGLNGKIFTIYKIKTMTDERSANGELLSDKERIFPIGALIRKLSIDELPQLINVLKGEMSIIGPRPLLPEYLSFYTKEQFKRHSVLPGITGLAQVKGRNAITWEKRFSYDQFYAKNISFFLDLYILVETVKTVFSLRGVEFEQPVELAKFLGSTYKNINVPVNANDKIIDIADVSA